MILWTLGGDALNEKQANWGGIQVFTLATTDGYVINFTPDGRTAAKSQQQEYETCSSMGKIESMILHVISIVDTLCDKQNARHRNGKTRAKGTTADPPMEHFCLAMDNYFTIPKIIACLCEMNIGVVGTSHFRKA